MDLLYLQMGFEHQVKELIQRKLTAQSVVESIEKQLDNRLKEKERQRKRAEDGLSNIYAHEEARFLMEELALREAKETLSAVLTEIETIKLTSDLKNISPSKTVAPEDIPDIRYNIKPYIDKMKGSGTDYQAGKMQIDMHGYFEINKCKVYTPELTHILTCQELEADNMNTNEYTLLNGFNYIKTYVDAYKQGVADFNKEFGSTPAIIYGENAESYIQDIHNNYFHTKLENNNEGWSYVKKRFPFIITHNAIKEHGYFSGMVSKVDEMALKYAKQFEKFEKCNHPSENPEVKNISSEEGVEKLSFDVNLWNKECFKLFEHLSENYSLKAKKQKFVNIWFYLEYDAGVDYHFLAKKEDYKNYVHKHFGVELKKVNKPGNYEKELHKLNALKINFCIQQKT